jgi:hypothetical protein
MLSRIIAPAVAEDKTAINKTVINIDENIRSFINAVKKSEQAIKTAIQDLKRELYIGFFGGNNGGAVG